MGFGGQAAAHSHGDPGPLFSRVFGWPPCRLGWRHLAVISSQWRACEPSIIHLPPLLVSPPCPPPKWRAKSFPSFCHLALLNKLPEVIYECALVTHGCALIGCLSRCIYRDRLWKVLRFSAECFLIFSLLCRITSENNNNMILEDKRRVIKNQCRQSSLSHCRLHVSLDSP